MELLTDAELKLLTDAELNTINSKVDITAIDTQPDIFDILNSYIDKGISIYEKSVDTKVNATKTVLDYPKLAITGALILAGMFLGYKLLIHKKGR